MLTAIFLLSAIAALLGGLLLWAEDRWPASDSGDVERINALLPQTQCAQCGYPGCRPYAAALAAGEAPPDRCPPGGEALARRLADLLGVPASSPLPGAPAPPPAVAVIDESACIGCARCLEVCPVDAILGAHRYLHTVIAADCTGCQLCVPACPVDCIRLMPADAEAPRPDLPTLAALPALAAHGRAV